MNTNLIEQEFYDTSKEILDSIEEVLGFEVKMINERRDCPQKNQKSVRYANKAEQEECSCCFSLTEVHMIEDKCDAKDATCFNIEHLSKICMPIKYKEEVVIVLELIPKNQDLKKRIEKNNQAFISRLEKIASLLETKYSDAVARISKYKYSSRIEGILNSINSGVVLYGEKGNVIYKNKSLVRILNELQIKNLDDFLNEIRKNKLLQSLLDSEKCIHPCELAIDVLGVKYNLLATISYLNAQRASKEVILTIQNIDYFKKQVMQSIEKNHIRLQFDNILGISKPIRELIEQAKKAASTDSNILIMGESGTGKELFARAIHNYSTRRDFAFVPINSGAIPYELFESELFGYVKGAFTGAFANKIGKFEVADKGTIFLDEVSAMPFELQVKLLRILQEMEVTRIGCNIVKKVDVKVVAATNVDLMKKVTEGLFREDLYYRLNVIPLVIPPLRQRREDIMYISKHFIDYYSKQLGKDVKGLSEEAKEVMMQYSWPGNIRELQNLIEYAVNFENGPLIRREIVEKRLNISEKNTFHHFEGRSLSDSVQQVEEEIIRQCIAKYSYCNSSADTIQKVCQELEISRATLYRKMKDYHIVVTDSPCLKNENLTKEA